ncbi:hypothetical protein A8B78_09965 [Jannaschia sp. EhC01]|nr:hypothetical protein A8B78_09965 [Jannaschia sp. EhC01]
MTKVAEWTFDEAPNSSVSQDTATEDGTAQNGVYQGGATSTGTGSGVFDGSDDYVEIPHDPGFDLDTGSIAITFTQETASVGDIPWASDGKPAAQTLFSRDSQNYDGGGHLTIYIRSDGTIVARHQTTDQSFGYEGGQVTLGEATSVIYSWGPDGSKLIVDGVEVDTGNQALTLAGNSEPITIGASQATSSDGKADNLQGFFDGEIEEVAIYDEPAQGNSVPCFTKGTLILTPKGKVPVEYLRVGDLVCTMDRGPQPIRWIGSRNVVLGRAGSGSDVLRPVRIRAGALGNGLPTRDLLVSRQHRMLISSRIAARMFHSPRVLAAAIKLVALPGIQVDEAVHHVAYLHLMFDQHEVIFAEDAPTESLYLGAEALKALGAEAWREILSLFPELSQRSSAAPVPALPIPLGRQQRQLAARHAKNNKPLLETYPVTAALAPLKQRRTGTVALEAAAYGKRHAQG